MRRFAEDTRVTIGRTRDQIARLLSDWNCEQIGWIDDFKESRVVLQFCLARATGGQAVLYRAQFTLQLESEASIRKRCTSSRGLAEGRFESEMADRGRREHRVLLLWLKAALEAVEEKIVPFETIFMPFFVGSDGQTVADVIVPQLHRLATTSARRLLEART